MVQSVKVPSGEERPSIQACARRQSRGCADQSPSERDRGARCGSRRKKLLYDRGTVPQIVRPRRPRLSGEAGEPLHTVGMDDARCITMAAEWNDARRRLHRDFDVVDEGEPALVRAVAGDGRSGDDEKRVIPPRADAVSASRRVATQSVGD